MLLFLWLPWQFYRAIIQSFIVHRIWKLQLTKKIGDPVKSVLIGWHPHVTGVRSKFSTGCVQCYRSVKSRDLSLRKVLSEFFTQHPTKLHDVEVTLEFKLLGDICRFLKWNVLCAAVAGGFLWYWMWTSPQILTEFRQKDLKIRPQPRYPIYQIQKNVFFCSKRKLRSWDYPCIGFEWLSVHFTKNWINVT